MQQKLEATLSKLISIPSVTENADACHEILAYARSELAMFGYFIHSQPGVSNPWFIATTKETKTPDILLTAHLDVVPAPDDLFVMKKQGGRLYGRGVYDMKFAAACYIEFLKAHADRLSTLNIGLLFTTDEEGNGLSMLDVLATGLRPKVVFLPDGGDNWSVEKRAKGLYGFQLTATGKSAHGSRPWEGENALHKLVDVVQILRSKYPSDSPSGPTLSVNKIRAGQATNQVPDHASVNIDFRSFEEQELTNVQLLVAELAATHGLELTVTNTGAPLHFDTANPNVQSFMHTLKELTQDDVHYCESYGASDARYFSPYGVPCIIIEPHGGGRHSNDEWLQTDDLEKYYQLIEQWVLSGILFVEPLQAEDQRITQLV